MRRTPTPRGEESPVPPATYASPTKRVQSHMSPFPFDDEIPPPTTMYPLPDEEGSTRPVTYPLHGEEGPVTLSTYHLSDKEGPVTRSTDPYTTKRVQSQLPSVPSTTKRTQPHLEPTPSTMKGSTPPTTDPSTTKRASVDVDEVQPWTDSPRKCKHTSTVGPVPRQFRINLL